MIFLNFITLYVLISKNKLLDRNKLLIGTIITFCILVGYAYTKYTISEINEEVFNNIEEVDWKVDDYVLFPPSMNLILFYKIRNPTHIPLQVEMNMTLYTGDYKISDLYENKLLLPKEEYIFKVTLVYDSYILEKIYGNIDGYDDLKADGFFKVRGKVLFFPIESVKVFKAEDFDFLLPMFDDIF